MLTEELTGIPDAIAIGVIQDAELILAGCKQQLPEFLPIPERISKFYGILNDKLQYGLPGKVQVEDPDPYFTIFDVFLGTKANGVRL